MSDVRMFLKFALCVFKTALEIRLNELIYYAYYVVDAHFLHSFTKGVLGTVQFLLYVRRPLYLNAISSPYAFSRQHSRFV